MCRENSCVHLSVEEATAAEETLLIYCKPVELYNILRHRAIDNVLSGISFQNLCVIFYSFMFFKNVYFETFIFYKHQNFLLSCEQSLLGI
jgi:hypothetical protein